MQSVLTTVSHHRVRGEGLKPTKVLHCLISWCRHGTNGRAVLSAIVDQLLSRQHLLLFPRQLCLKQFLLHEEVL